MMGTEVRDLENKINQLRRVLILVAENTGLNSNETLFYSQKLDELITRYQKLKMGNVDKFEIKSRINSK